MRLIFHISHVYSFCQSLSLNTNVLSSDLLPTYLTTLTFYITFKILEAGRLYFTCAFFVKILTSDTKAYCLVTLILTFILKISILDFAVVFRIQRWFKMLPYILLIIFYRSVKWQSLKLHCLIYCFHCQIAKIHTMWIPTMYTCFLYFLYLTGNVYFILISFRRPRNFLKRLK